MGWLINLKGKRFGRLKVISRLENDNHKQVVWKCLCDCGNFCNIISRSLIHNRTKSCGCLHSDLVRKKPYYHIFSSIKRRQRYYNKSKKRKCYFSFDEFLDFVKIKNCHYCKGPIKWKQHCNGDSRPYNLDRKNNDVGYTKENCVVCCPCCNQMKRSLSYDEFYEFTRPIRLYKKSIKHLDACDCNSNKHECCDICTGYAKAEKYGRLKDKK